MTPLAVKLRSRAAAVALLTAVSACGTSAADQVATNSSAPGGIAASVATPAPPQAAAEQDDAQALPVEQADQESKTYFGSRYAGAWIDRTMSPSVLRLGVVDLTAKDRASWARRTHFREPARVVLVDRHYSVKQLKSYESAAEHILTKRHALCGVGIDEEHATVAVTIRGKQTTEILRDLRRQIPKDVLRISADPCTVHG